MGETGTGEVRTGMAAGAGVNAGGLFPAGLWETAALELVFGEIPCAITRMLLFSTIAFPDTTRLARVMAVPEKTARFSMEIRLEENKVTSRKCASSRIFASPVTTKAGPSIMTLPVICKSPRTMILFSDFQARSKRDPSIKSGPLTTEGIFSKSIVMLNKQWKGRHHGVNAAIAYVI